MRWNVVKLIYACRARPVVKRNVVSSASLFFASSTVSNIERCTYTGVLNRLGFKFGEFSRRMVKLNCPLTNLKNTGFQTRLLKMVFFL